MDVTKTTFLLPNALRARLKAVAAARGVTVTRLLTEGACLVLAKYQRSTDRQELARRADAARDRLRRGLYSGSALTGVVDELIYGTPPRRRKAR